MELMQLATEIEPVLDIYRAKKPERVLEIGCWDGGSLKLWIENARPGATVVAVDLQHRNQAEYPSFLRPEVETLVITGNSLMGETIDQIRGHGPYDWVFVDGGHELWEVRSDVEVTLPLIRPGGTLVLHDITQGDNDDFFGPGLVFAELERLYRAERFQDMTPAPWSRGLGVVHIP